ncbi:MAG: hypothetical protein H0V82_13355 [Candidatus Protochlamydia sp.]|nr:hypothetical protein [Candidatus Protochlamydia sp.]
MHPSLKFLESEPVIALLVAAIIFFITLFLVVKQWIGFSLTLLLLVFALVSGFIVNNQHVLDCYNKENHELVFHGKEDDAFKIQIFQAIEDLKVEVNSEKENIQHMMAQIQEVLNEVDSQKQNLQSFIDSQKDAAP